jgi:hypothetical protein
LDISKNVQNPFPFLLFGIFLLLRNREEYYASFYKHIWCQLLNSDFAQFLQHRII